MDLQTFATKDDEPADTSTEETKTETIDNNKEDKTFTQEDVNSIVQTRVNRASKSLMQEIEDLKEQLKTQNLSAEEKKSYEEQKKEKELEELKTEVLKYKLTNKATKVLAEKGYVATEDILNIVLKNDEDETLKAIDTVVDLVDNLVNERIKEKAREATPKSSTNNSTGDSGFNVAEYANKNRKI